MNPETTMPEAATARALPGLDQEVLKRIIEAAVRIARMLGLDVKAEEFNRAKMQAKFDRVAPKVVARLDKDGVTPANLSDDEAEKRTLIRAAQYLLLKEAIAHTTGKKQGSNLLADFIRDRHDDAVVPVVMPQVNAALSTADLVAAVAAAEVEQFN
jgi:hypothetical protein